jgi:hypothetical protein
MIFSAKGAASSAKPWILSFFNRFSLIRNEFNQLLRQIGL